MEFEFVVKSHLPVNRSARLMFSLSSAPSSGKYLSLSTPYLYQVILCWEKSGSVLAGPSLLGMLEPVCLLAIVVVVSVAAALLFGIVT